ncbi:unnamed protein product [Calicophoron daubneyi]|uniref:Uncharacterized protein n=1 Tax=Calicophoron daubneyi TaxID=300641 RepID=A0AAV2TC58_CALDB
MNVKNQGLKVIRQLHSNRNVDKKALLEKLRCTEDEEPSSVGQELSIVSSPVVATQQSIRRKSCRFSRSGDHETKEWPDQILMAYGIDTPEPLRIQIFNYPCSPIVTET